MPTNPNPRHRTAGAVVASLALGAALTGLGTVSDAASAAVGGLLAGVVLVDQARRSRPRTSPAPVSDHAQRCRSDANPL